MRVVLRKNPMINLNKKASELLLSNKLHAVSNKCCLYNKEKSMMKWQKKNHKKAIIGVRQSESRMRKS